MGLFNFDLAKPKIYQAYLKADFLDDKPGVVSQSYFLCIEPVYDFIENDIVGIQLFEDHLEMRNPDADSTLSFDYSNVKDIKYGSVEEVYEKEKSVGGRALISGCCLFCLLGLFINILWGVITGIVGAIVGAISALRPEKQYYTHTELSMCCTSPSGKEYVFRFKCDPTRSNATSFVNVLRKYTF